MDGLLECGTCGENFDLKRRRPKLLPCGHTLCCECVRNSMWDGSISCPTDKQTFYADPRNLQDDLQLVCWLEATSQGVLECVCCGCAFDWLLRRPAALDCGHAVCRVCLQEAADALLLRSRGPCPSASAALLPPPPPALTRRPSRRDSVDESWDYSQEDGDTCSSVSSLPSDASDSVVAGDGGAVGDLVADCPVEGCARGVRARDHHHLLNCLDGSAATQRHTKKRAALRCDDDLRAELLDKLALLEDHVTGQRRTLEAVLNMNVNMNGVLPGGRALGLGHAPVLATDHLTARSKGNRAGHTASGERHVDEEELRAVLATLRRVVEHKDSPRSEQPAVFKQIAASHSNLPDLLQNEKSQASPSTRRSRDDVSGVEALKEVKIALDVWDLALCSSGEMRVKKEALLRSDSKVWKLTGVDCWPDPEWTLRLLRRVAPDVEHLQLRYAGREHLQVVRDAMPHLRRLELRGWRGLELLEKPFCFDETPARNRDTLEWLEVFLPAPTALSLLRAHRHSLRKLRFIVADEWAQQLPSSQTSSHRDLQQVDEGIGSDGDLSDGEDVMLGEVVDDEEDGFSVVPYAEDCLRSRCWDDLLQELGPRPRPSEENGDHQEADADAAVGKDSVLSSVALLWPSSRSHDFWHCQRFSRVLRTARPHLGVDCDVCRMHHRDRADQDDLAA